MDRSFVIRKEINVQATFDIGEFKIAVGAIIVNSNGEILLTQRSSSRQNNVGQWEFIYGRVHVGEHPIDTAHREAREEVGLEVEPLHIVGIKHFKRTKEDTDFVGLVILMRAITEDVMADSAEISDYQWISPEKALSFIAEYDKEFLVKAIDIMKSGVV